MCWVRKPADETRTDDRAGAMKATTIIIGGVVLVGWMCWQVQAVFMKAFGLLP